jgi:hypothetical protein
LEQDPGRPLLEQADDWAAHVFPARRFGGGRLELPPGKPWQPELESQIESIRSAAVFIGGDGTGPWQSIELRALLNQFVQRGCPVIPVILPSVTLAAPKLPTFLQDFTWVDYRLDDPPPLDHLIWGITSKKPLPPGSKL